MARRAFIVGGTGQIGRAIAVDLLRRGWQVTVSTRSGISAACDLAALGVCMATMDREEPGALAKAIGFGTDALIDTIAFTQAHADQLLDVQGDVGSFAVISSASVYRDDAGRTLNQAGETGFPDFPDPISEGQATVAPGPETYSTRKVALERRLLDHAKRPVCVIRPCAVHGPHSKHPREWWFVKRMRDRRPAIPLAYRGLSRFHTSATINIAALIGAAFERPENRVLNSADPDVLTVAQIATLIAEHVGYSGAITPLDIGDDKGEAAIGETPWSTPLPFILDMTAANALGYRPATTYAQAAPKLCDWLIANQGEDWRETFPVFKSYPSDPFDYGAEDRFLAAAPDR
jgi:nucleoside-diphosphate-sugar epimerase